MADGVTLNPTTLTNQEIVLLLQITNEANPHKNELDFSTVRHRFPVTNEWMQTDKVMTQGGTHVEHRVVLGENGNARFTKPYARAARSSTSNVKVTRMTLCLAEGWYDYERTEVQRNSGDAHKLLDLQAVRRSEGDVSLAEIIEDRAFKSPDDANDDINPWGVPYYFVPITAAQAAAGTSGHQGENPVYGIYHPDHGSTGASVGHCAGIDASLDDNLLWRCYNDRWAHDDPSADFDDDDVERIVEAFVKLRFEAPMNARDFSAPEFQRFRMYAGYPLIKVFNKAARANNDSLGADLGRYSGEVVVRGTPVKWNEEVENWTNSDGDNAWTLIGINHNYWHPVVMEGDFFEEMGPYNEREQPRVFSMVTYLQFNFFCRNRRWAGFRIDSEPQT